MPSDRVPKTIKKLCRNFWGENAEKCVDYAENTLNYGEILTVNEIDNKAFPVYRTTVKPKALQSLTHSLSSFIE